MEFVECRSVALFVSVLTLFSNCYYFEGFWSVGERSFVADLLSDAVFV